MECLEEQKGYNTNRGVRGGDDVLGIDDIARESKRGGTVGKIGHCSRRRAEATLPSIDDDNVKATIKANKTQQYLLEAIFSMR